MLNNDVNPKTLSRLELLKLAHTLRVSDADVMTRAELRAAIERASRPDPRPSAQPVTWLGVARRLLASIVEQGLHLPDAAALIRGGASVRPFPSGPPPVATVTLARIYAAQGHLARGISTLDEVLKSDPDHDLARDLRTQLVASREEQRAQEGKLRAAAATAAEARAETRQAEAPASPAKVAASQESSVAQQLLGAVPTPGDAPASEALSGDEITLSSKPVEPAATARRENGAPLEPMPNSEARAEPSTPEPSTPEPSTPESQGAAAREPPRPAGLVLLETLETHEPGTYLYWELGTPAPPANGNGADLHWVWVVTHAPRGAGCERRERRFPVNRASGAVRIEGLPGHAVVRAKLTRGDSAEAPPLVVASSVWVGEALALERAEAGFVPQPATNPGALAARAADHLANAAPIYY